MKHAVQSENANLARILLAKGLIPNEFCIEMHDLAVESGYLEIANVLFERFSETIPLDRLKGKNWAAALRASYFKKALADVALLKKSIPVLDEESLLSAVAASAQSGDTNFALQLLRSTPTSSPSNRDMTFMKCAVLAGNSNVARALLANGLIPDEFCIEMHNLAVEKGFSRVADMLFEQLSETIPLDRLLHLAQRRV